MITVNSDTFKVSERRTEGSGSLLLDENPLDKSSLDVNMQKRTETGKDLGVP